MPPKWIIGVITIYLAILLATSIANQANQFTAGEVAKLQSMTLATGTDITNIGGVGTTGGDFSLITNVWTYIKTFIQAAFLWSPSLWTGNWLWFYYFFCLPICIAMVVSIVFVLRGVRSG